LEAAENRRKEYENRLKEKLQQETRKPEAVTRSVNTSLNESMERIQTDSQDKIKQSVVRISPSLSLLLPSPLIITSLFQTHNLYYPLPHLPQEGPLTLQENREAHLKQLRDRLKAKEERARLVREKKRMMQQGDTVSVN
jgi:hypothetical protein